MGFENGKVLRVSLRAVHFGGPQEEVNTFHYDLEDSVVPADANDPQVLADTFRDDVRPTWAALFSNEWTIQPVAVVEEADPLDPFAARSGWQSGSTVPGSRAPFGDRLPVAMCAVATLRSDHIGRRFRGRIFLGGENVEADQAAGTWVGSRLAEWQAFLDVVPRVPDIAPPASTSTATWSVYSRTQRSQSRDPYLSAISSVALGSRTHWLRSRER